jgi:hypothetical protein
MQGARPVPHLRVETAQEPHQVLGYVYRGQDQRWTLDFREDAVAQRAAASARTVLRGIDRRGVPRVQRHADGRPQQHPDGSYVLDGVVPLDTTDPGDPLQNLRLCLPPSYRTEFVDHQ